jgi:DNA-binding XRE family transcriptional regulator
MNNIIRVQVVHKEQKGGAILNNNLKHLREQKGISQVEFAKMLGISVFHLNKIENDSKSKKNLTIRIALKASKILNVSLDEIFLK